MDINNIKAYDVIMSKDIRELDTKGYILKHKKTGARVVLMENADENKVFYIGFRTPPKESTGVMHILEHSVLCGSKNFPVKDPFIELAKGSLNTFLNAMTYPDKTVYPVASCNDKDFQNLMHIYLDAVFYPNILKHDLTFRQEGWHYELENKDSELKINGVVYSEMKGAFSSPDDVFERAVFNSLFPDTPYGEESGGDPKVIPDLTYEHYIEVYKSYYHPSNSYIYLYGNMDMAKKLDFIDREYLSNFDAIEIDSSIPNQKPFDEPVDKVLEYSVTENESLTDNSYLSYNCAMDNNLDREEYIAWQIIDYALCSSPGAILKQALLDAGLGKDIYSQYDNGVKQPYFSIVSKFANEDRKEEFNKKIEDVLKSIVKDGFDKDTLRAGLNISEFKYRENDFGSYPAGLMYGLQALDSWLYDDMKPFIHIAADATFKSLREKIDTDYFEKLLEKGLLINNHKSFVTVIPKVALVAKEEEELKARLAKYKASLSDEEINKLIEDTKELVEYQEKEDSAEALKCIPVLEISDIKKETEKLYNELKSIDGKKSLYHPIHTNGIDYVRVMFCAQKLPERLMKYISLFKGVLGLVDTKNYTYQELFTKVCLETGGIVPITNIYENIKVTDDYNVYFEIKGKCLEGNLTKMMDLIKEIIFESKFEDEKRLLEIIQQILSHSKESMISGGHSVAVARGMSYVTKGAAISDIISGMTSFRVLEELEKDFANNKGEFIAALKELCKYLFTKENVMFDFTGSEDEYKIFEGEAAGLISKLSDKISDGVSFSPDVIRKNEGFTSSAQVQYVCRCGDYRNKGLEYTGALRALKVIMGYDYLWNNIRVKGGAYGCMSGFNKNGECYFVSYRDPNLSKTIEVYEGVCDYLSNFNVDDRAMTQYIIGAISELDVPQTPVNKARRSLGAYMCNATIEDYQQERDELLAVKAETIRGLVPYVKALLDWECVCVVGNEDEINKESGLFNKVLPLFN